MDFMISLPKSNDNDVILVVVDKDLANMATSFISNTLTLQELLEKFLLKKWLSCMYSIFYCWR